MNHNQAWSADRPSQALDGLHDCMAPPPASLAQPPVDVHPAPWAPGQTSGYPPAFDEPFVHAQQQGSMHAYGLPSPAPTVPAASPPAWPRHDLSSVAGCWDPVSPISPTAGDGAGGRFSSQLDILLYSSGTITPPTFDTGLQDWPRNPGFHLNFNHPYPRAPAPPSLPPHGIPNEFNAPWVAPIQAPGPPNEPFLEDTLFHHVPLPNLAGSLSRVTSQIHPTNQPPKRLPPSPPNQLTSCSPPKKTKSPGPLATSTTTTTKTTTAAAAAAAPLKLLPTQPKPDTSSPSLSPSPSTGPTLRTAARRFKRPAPSPKPGESAEHQRARTNHNMVEQQYRHRLHARFEALLDVLPERVLEALEGGESGGTSAALTVAAATASGGGGGGVLSGRRVGGGGSGEGSSWHASGVRGKNNRRMSKVDVLSRAERVIRFLEGDIARKSREVEGLRRERELAFGRAAMAASGAWVATGR